METEYGITVRAVDIAGNKSDPSATTVFTTEKGVPTNGLVGHWKMTSEDLSNGEIEDYSGNGNAGTMYGSIEAGNASPVGESLYFDGSGSDYIEIPESGQFSLWTSTATGTVSVWFRFESKVNTSDPEAKIFSLGKQWAQHPMPTKGSTTQFTPRFDLFGDNNLDEVGDTLDYGTWHHWVETLDNPNDVVTTWINGTKIASTPTTNTSGTPTKNLFLGTQGPKGANAFKGDISESLIYDRVLSDSEIQSLYNAGST